MTNVQYDPAHLERIAREAYNSIPRSSVARALSEDLLNVCRISVWQVWSESPSEVRGDSWLSDKAKSAAISASRNLIYRESRSDEIARKSSAAVLASPATLEPHARNGEELSICLSLFTSAERREYLRKHYVPDIRVSGPQAFRSRLRESSFWNLNPLKMLHEGNGREREWAAHSLMPHLERLDPQPLGTFVRQEIRLVTGEDSALCQLGVAIAIKTALPGFFDAAAFHRIDHAVKPSLFTVRSVRGDVTFGQFAPCIGSMNVFSPACEDVSFSQIETIRLGSSLASVPITLPSIGAGKSNRSLALETAWIMGSLGARAAIAHAEGTWLGSTGSRHDRIVRWIKHEDPAIARVAADLSSLLLPDEQYDCVLTALNSRSMLVRHAAPPIAVRSRQGVDLLIGAVRATHRRARYLARTSLCHLVDTYATSSDESMRDRVLTLLQDVLLSRGEFKHYEPDVWIKHDAAQILQTIIEGKRKMILSQAEKEGCMRSLAQVLIRAPRLTCPFLLSPMADLLLQPETGFPDFVGHFSEKAT